MKEKILTKMEVHVKSILDKPIISNEEYALISGYLTRIEMDEMQKDQKRKMDESQERLKSAMTLLGGAF